MESKHVRKVVAHSGPHEPMDWELEELERQLEMIEQDSAHSRPSRLRRFGNALMEGLIICGESFGAPNMRHLTLKAEDTRTTIKSGTDYESAE